MDDSMGCIGYSLRKRATSHPHRSVGHHHHLIITCLQEALCADPDPAAGARVEQRVVHHADRALLEPVRGDVDLAPEQEHLLDHREDQHLAEGHR